MNHALSLGLKGFLNLRSFAVVPKSLKFRAFVFVKPIAMGSQRVPAKSRKFMDIQPALENDVIKEIVVKGVGDDSCTVDRMTVAELRLKLRSLGVPAKGSKRDLVSALKSSMNQKVDGEGSLVGEHEVSTNDKPNGAQNNSKRKTKSSSSKDHTQNISNGDEDSGKKTTKRRVKEEPVENSIVEVKNMLVETKQELSIKTNEVTGKKPTRAKRKVSSEITSSENGVLVEVEPSPLSENHNEAWTVLAHKKPQKGWIPYNPRTMRPPPLSDDTKYVKLMSWNVNGLRALLKSEVSSALRLAQREGFDVLCLQETKIQEKDVEAIKQSLLEGYDNSFWTCSVSKLGYSGTAIISRIKPLSVTYGLGISDHDSEGRLVTVEFDNFYLLCGYVPNSGDGLKRLSYRVTEWDPALSSHMKDLEKSKPVILTGDLNCAHEEIDIYNPAGNKRNAGFTDEERQSFETNFLNKGFVDTFRRQHPGVVGYTYWGYRHGGRKNNRGWRLDYFLVSESIVDKVHDSYILPDVNGSDHCPIGLILKL